MSFKIQNAGHLQEAMEGVRWALRSYSKDTWHVNLLDQIFRGWASPPKSFLPVRGAGAGARGEGAGATKKYALQTLN